MGGLSIWHWLIVGVVFPAAVIVVAILLTNKPKEASHGNTQTDYLENTEVPFFPISLLKLSILSFFTFGLYEIYWFYKNWDLIKTREKTKINPLLRALFGYLWCYPLLCKIRDYGKLSGTQQSIYAGLLSIGLIITGGLLSRLPSPYWLISLLSFLFLLPAQALSNRINAKVVPGHDTNSVFSVGNVVALVIGTVFWILVILGMVLPAQPAPALAEAVSTSPDPFAVQLSTEMAEVSKQLPMKVDEITTLIAASSEGRTITYEYNVSRRDGSDDELREAITKNVCDSKDLMTSMRDYEATIKLNYTLPNAQFPLVLEIKYAQCPPLGIAK